MLAAVQPMRSPAPAEWQLATEAAAELDFVPVLPAVLPSGYRLTSTSLVPFGRTLVTFEFEGPGAKRFRLTEQLATLSFEAQFELGRLPCTRVRQGDTMFTIFHGAFDGTEPVDGLNWHENRRVINWDQGNLICRLELRVGEAPSVAQGLKVARSLVPLTELVQP